MSNAYFRVPKAVNEPIYQYEPGSTAREKLQDTLKALRSKQVHVPLYIGSEEIETADKRPMSPPHDHQHILGHYSYGTGEHVKKAIDSALEARKKWSKMAWQDRAAIFLKAADLISGPYRYEMNAGTMLAQSKNCFQSEIDAVCELADFLRFNVEFMTEIYEKQPISAPGTWNRLEYRPLEGFVFAITPFNFTAIAGNLPMSAVLMGNVCVWKPAESQMYSANQVMRIFKEAGLPDGVINMVVADGPEVGDIVFKHPEFSGLHFTGSTAVFKHLWKEIGNNIDIYKQYPRIVGETGGKDFVFAHHTAKPAQVATGLARGAFEFQGQKCSAASRAYIPDNIWPEVKEELVKQVNSFKVGPTEDFGNFVNAVIDKRAFDKIASYIDFVKDSKDAEIIAGGNYDDSKGYFIEPTVVVAKDPKFRTMCEEIFGPVLTIYVYPKDEWKETVKILNDTSEYALTGAIFSQDRYVLSELTDLLEQNAGNFYLNDKPTGAVVGQQPFGGARGSGTNDKAGFYLNLLRWTSVRTLKETFVPPTDYRYPFLG
ncbi:L-glutamate gamma-semialdehyde dehydrogenase [Luteibaculum oceani]|uniref:L-glutamate gamma-semialdehyde dehydrogenase n=1 Tax=Luteibaculum oceani TaxID=1294296 RepID=A0A5C6V297_9FLAO|nr:L-glutamate gamma-semialdehyde dehydrogenase [Luteibaculum oceani]TXC78576.1 L-glutamate gamma-semialdehyde dehydrogenase [Luteibaculum oceani]